jgi:hypothetical protein
MSMRVLYGACLAGVLLAGCSGDSSSNDSRNQNNGGVHVGTGGTTGNHGGAGSDDFGNTTGGVSTDPKMPTATGGDAGFVPGTMCEVGKFCAPTGADPNGCGTLTLQTDIEVTVNPGNLLIIFDQSASMNEPWGAADKLTAAKDALVAAITPLADKLTIGAIFLPTTLCAGIALEGGAVAPIEDPSQINFMPGPAFLQAWDAKWQSVPGFGVGTPLNEAFDRADVALQNALKNMTLTGKIAVIAFTDGEPTCFPDEMTQGIPTKPEPDHAADWLGQGVQTYMVGLPGAIGVDLLNQVAVSGGTMSYITPDDPTQLAMVLKQVVEEQVSMGFNSCSIDLDPAADPVDKLQLVATEQVMGTATEEAVAHDLGNGGGWTITPDGKHVELVGSVCSDAMGGRFQALQFKYGCKELPPLPPVKGPD